MWIFLYIVGLVIISSSYYRRTVGTRFVESLQQQLETRFSQDTWKTKSTVYHLQPVVISLSDQHLLDLEDDLYFWDTDQPLPLGSMTKS